MYINWCVIGKMSQQQKNKQSSKPPLVDGTMEPQAPWYLDLFLPSGGILERVHLFFKDRNDSPFKNCGPVQHMKTDTGGIDMSSCLCVKTTEGISYLVDPMAFSFVSLMAEGEMTMKKAGWLENTSEGEDSVNATSFVTALKRVNQHLLKKRNSDKRKRQHEEKDATPIKALKEMGTTASEVTDIVPHETIEVVDLDMPSNTSVAIMVDPASSALLDSIDQPPEKELDRQVAKTSKSGLDGYLGIEQYFKFGVQFTALICVDYCNLAPDSYKCRPLSDEYVKYLLKTFAGHSRPCSLAADLMPYDPHTNVPLKSDEVHLDKLQQYHYWILSGQHSIMAARAFLRNKSKKYASRKLFYEKRLARIIVDAPREVSVRISRMENIETQTSMKTQPYVEILKHARGQWLAYSKPTKPKGGVPVGHESRKLWDVSLHLFLFKFQWFKSSILVCDK